MDITAVYIDERNAITQPERMVFVSHYFRSHWMARLGPTGTAIVIYLRGACYHNRKSGETRDTVQLSQKKIAQGCGCSVATLKRELEGNAALRRFVQIAHEWERNAATGQVRQLENVYQIAMDDPLTDEDEIRLKLLVEERIAREGAAKDSARKRIRLSTSPAAGSNAVSTASSNAVMQTRQGDTPVAQNELLRPVAQNELTSPQNELPLKESLLKTTSSETLNVVPAGNKVSPLSRRQAELAEGAIALTGDEKSRKRYQQLAGIVVEAGREDLWDTVFKITAARLKKASPPLGAPGAYFCGTLTTLLRDAGVYAPVGSPAERADVQAQIAASFKQAGRGPDR